ncbi:MULTISPECIES: hypothetical protein [Paenibacillus]|uniref:Uncharacterized protein n=1 Tax=Paenibacillus violae TaxID=3077234 RepID=A0ABU3RM83_9BACL|nr:MULTISPECIES: hypothetical protein [Paenibacillus]MDU0205233.1 hypothetical protein [Paenibacillus sp. PFR10]MEC0270994.1 hypothetical protein [Paenibacillus anseongense]
MKKSKWTKWQMGIVIGVLLFYLFQEVKDSPQFLAAVSAAALSKDNSATVTAQKDAPNNRGAENTVRRGRNHDRMAAGAGSAGSTGSTGGAESSQPQLKAHTRSQAS